MTRVDSSQLSQVNRKHLHWHDGCTCHGSPTLGECTLEAMRNGWAGKVLERTDVRDGIEVKCYSLVNNYFDHYAKQGRLVAEVRQEWKVIEL